MSKTESKLSATETFTESMRLSFPKHIPMPFDSLGASMLRKCLNAAFDNPLLTDATTKFEKLPLSSDFSVISFLIADIVEIFSFWAFSYLLLFVV